MKSAFGRRDLELASEPAAASPATATANETSLVSPAALRGRVLKEIDARQAVSTPPHLLRREIELLIHQIANEDRLGLSGREQALLAEELVQDMTGYGPLEPLLKDDQITDIMVNGPDNIYIERKGKLERATVRFRDASHITMVAQKIAAGVGRRVDETNPMVDARLSDGSRVNVILPPLSIDSPCVSIRKFARHRLDLSGMVENGTMSTGVAKLLGISAAARLNVLV